MAVGKRKTLEWSRRSAIAAPSTASRPASARPAAAAPPVLLSKLTDGLRPGSGLPPTGEALASAFLARAPDAWRSPLLRLSTVRVGVRSDPVGCVPDDRLLAAGAALLPVPLDGLITITSSPAAGPETPAPDCCLGAETAGTGAGVGAAGAFAEVDVGALGTAGTGGGGGGDAPPWAGTSGGGGGASWASAGEAVSSVAASAMAPTSLPVDACKEPSRGSEPETDADTLPGLSQGRSATAIEHSLAHSVLFGSYSAMPAGNAVVSIIGATPRGGAVR